MGEQGFDLPGGESTAAALRRAEQERDQALAEVSGVRASLAELAEEVEDLKGMLAMRTGQLKAATRERDLARAELESARQELDAIRARAAA
jgi:chromosome segregation ATPase